MLPSHEIEFARRIYKDILNGYSAIEFEGKELYIKHFSDIDFGHIQEFKNKKHAEAKQKGLLSEKDQIELLIKNESWSFSEEQKFKDLVEELSTLRSTRSKAYIERQIKPLTERIGVVSRELKPIQKERDSIVGLTLEKFSEDKVNEEYLRASLHIDKEFKTLAFSRDEYFDLDHIRLKVLLILNNHKLTELRKDNIDMVAVMPFFLNAVMLSKDNPQIFFGKPIVGLTNYQSELFTQGIRFCGVINKGQAPPSTAESAEYLVDFYEGALGAPRKTKEGVESGKMMSGATKKTRKAKECAGSTLFGANKKESKSYEAANKNSRTKISSFKSAREKLAKEQGKEEKTHFTMFDMMQIHGDISAEEADAPANATFKKKEPKKS